MVVVVVVVAAAAGVVVVVVVVVVAVEPVSAGLLPFVLEERHVDVISYHDARSKLSEVLKVRSRSSSYLTSSHLI